MVIDAFLACMRTNGYMGAFGARFTKNHKSATYELLTISGTYDKLTTMAEVSLENLTLQLKTKPRFVTQNYRIGSFCLPFSDVGRI